MSFMFANSGDFRNPSHADLLDKALASVRRMCVDYAAAQTVGLRSERDAAIGDLARAVADLSDAREIILAACSERDALADERDRLASQCETLRALLADTRPAIVARTATNPIGLDESLLPRIDAALA